MVPPLTFRKLMLDEVQSMLQKRGYLFRDDVANRDPGERYPDCFLPFSKPLGALGYGHIIFDYDYSQFAEAPSQRFDVILIRYAGTEPWPQIPGHPPTDITGYLPGPEASPLALIFNPQTEPDRWVFHSEAELVRLLRCILQRLDGPVLAWLECPESSQFVHVEKAWYIEPFANYMTGRWDAAMAYAAVRGFAPPQFLMEAGDDDETLLVLEVHRILRVLQLPPPTEQIKQAILEYLLACLQDRETFRRDTYLALW